MRSKEDVQVFTSLPPKVDGDIKSYLRLRIPKINYIVQEAPVIDNVEAKNKNASYPNRQKFPLIKPSLNNDHQKGGHSLPSILAKCVWWGEDTNSKGAIFRPKILDLSSNVATASGNNRKTQTTAKYMIRSGAKQFSAYLGDMKTLDIDLIKEETMESIGKVQIHEIQQLTLGNPIKGYFSAYDKNQTKVAEVLLHMQLEPLTQRDDSVESVASRAKLSDHENEACDESQRASKNINEFNSKYQLFEQKQLHSQTDAKFYAESYETHVNYDEDLRKKNDNLRNPVIETLIERGTKLKNEMLKSSKSASILDDDSTYKHLNSKKSTFNYLDSLIDMDYDYIDSDTNEFASHDADLSCLVNDPDLLSALIYTKTKSVPHADPSPSSNDYEQELQDLLKPKLFKQRIDSSLAVGEKTFKDKFVRASKLKQENEIAKYSSNTIRNRNKSWVSVVNVQY